MHFNSSVEREKSDSKEELPHKAPKQVTTPTAPKLTAVPSKNSFFLRHKFNMHYIQFNFNWNVTNMLLCPGVSQQTASTSAEPHRMDLSAATFLDVAVLRCLFIPQWQEEGVFWALQYLYHRYF